MAKKQTRRTISVSGIVYLAVTQEADRRNTSAAALVEGILRKEILIPQAVSDLPFSWRSAIPKETYLVQPRSADGAPSWLEVHALWTECQAKHVKHSRAHEKRRASLAFAEELRKRKLLLPINEGYAPGSWAKP